jgi:hypothetical protein
MLKNGTRKRGLSLARGSGRKPSRASAYTRRDEASRLPWRKPSMDTAAVASRIA